MPLPILESKYLELNSLWSKTIDKFNEINCPKGFYVYYYEDQDETQFTTYYLLAYLKINNEWTIAHTSEGGTFDPEVTVDKFDWKPILNCSLENRLKAVKGIKKLHNMLLIITNGEIDRLENTIKELKSIINEL